MKESIALLLSLALKAALLGVCGNPAPAFFTGQKSAEEVARLVQSKASLYMSEQS